jgi:hypothetical protein
MIIKNRTKFVLIAGIGFSLFSGLSHTAFEVMYFPVIGAIGLGLYMAPRVYNAYLRSHNLTTEAKKNEEFFQQVSLDYNTCLREHPLEEGAEGIPPACRPQFDKLKAAVDAMEVRNDTTQN